MRHLLLTTVIIVTLAVAGCNPVSLTGVGPNRSPEDLLPSPQSSLREAEVIVFHTEAEPYLGHPSTDATINNHPDAISTVIGFWWQIDRNDPGRVVPFSVMTEEYMQQVVASAKANGMRVEGLFHNLLYGRTDWSIDTIVRLLQDPDAQGRLARQIAEKSLELGLSGVNIDVENVPPAYREQMTRFVQTFASVIHANGLEVSISVPSTTRNDPNNGWSGAFDYEKIGAAVDRVILMTYDEHGFVSGPGPIASSGWVERVVSYATSVIEPEKVFVGLAGYGFDWGSTGAPRYISYNQAARQIEELGISPSWSQAANSPHYTYYNAHGERREVWYENASSHSWKLNLVNEYGLGGVALWRGGLEDEALWDVITSQFNVKKY